MNEFWRDNYWVAVVIALSGIVIILVIIAAVICYRRHSRYDYTPLQEYLSLPAKLQREKKMERNTIRETALLNCQFYLRAHAGKYTFIEQLPDLGSRVDRHWFLVRYRSQSKNMLLSVCNRATNCSIPFNSNTHKVLRELLKCIKHPYVWPVVDVDLLEEQELVVLIQNYNPKGSLKDYIYNERPDRDWDCKYGVKGRGLAIKEIRMFGRQILEALLYLQEGGLPQHCHVQAGNVILDKGTCKLSGYENILLGHTSRLFPNLCKKLKQIPQAFDTIAFGHLVYEMGAGSALEDTVIIPDRTHFKLLKHQQVVQVLEFIFDVNETYPSLKEVMEHEFFQNIKLKALERKPATEIQLTSAMRSLLKAVKKGRILKSQSFRPASKHTRPRRSSPQPSLESNQAETTLSTESHLNNIPPPTNETRISSSIHSTHPVIPPPPPLMTVKVITSKPSQLDVPSVSRERSALLSDIQKGIALKKTSRIEMA
ncbi:slowpoke-binding protein-like [Asterias amurensis]|uniref:slowpoke-binding protein-like n=1 Tax=Asterias amurensis TaxID=7602 RepID=UPI003AB1CF34